MDSDQRERSANYLCITRLLARGNKQLHRIFLEKWAAYCKLNKNVNEWKNDITSGTELLPLCKSVTKPQQVLIKDGNTQAWDISLTYLAIEAVSKEIRKIGGTIDSAEKLLIDGIKNHRNKHSHGTYELSNDVFEDEWKILSNILLQLGDDCREIAAVKTEIFELKQGERESTSEFTQLKIKLNKAIMDNKYNEAKEINDQMLDLSDYSREDYAFVFVRRSEIFLHLETDVETEQFYTNAERAKLFASVAIENYPTWWEGFYYLAKAQIKYREYRWAAKNLETAVKLNPQSVEAKNELIYIQREIRMHSYMKKGVSHDRCEHRAEIEEAMKNGSDTANRVFSIWTYLDYASDALKNNDQEMTIYFLAKAIRLDFNLFPTYSDEFKPFVNEYIEGREKDIDAVTCYTILNAGTPGSDNMLIDFAKTNAMDIALHAAIVPVLVLKYGQVMDALLAVENMLIDEPKSLRLLYCRLFVLGEINESSSNYLTAIDNFLKTAPSDHERVPECIYRKAKYYYANRNLELFKKYFTAAQESEKKQLPCFLPYKCVSKNSAETLYNAVILKKGAKPTDNLPPLLSLSLEKQNLIIQHRQAFIASENNKSKPNKQKQKMHVLPEFLKPKHITLKDMDSTVEKFYHGYFLIAKVIDWAYLSSNQLFTIFEDVNHDVQQLVIQNWEYKGKFELDTTNPMKTFYPHSTILIIYPTMKKMNNGDFIISVENIMHIKPVPETTVKKCFTCGKISNVLKCSKCLVSQYCSKECQKIDWINLKHKDVCSLLKKYADKVNTL